MLSGNERSDHPGTGSRTAGSMRLRREGDDRRRAGGDPPQRPGRLAGFLPRMWRSAVRDSSRGRITATAVIRPPAGGCLVARTQPEDMRLLARVPKLASLPMCRFVAPGNLLREIVESGLRCRAPRAWLEIRLLRHATHSSSLSLRSKPPKMRERSNQQWKLHYQCSGRSPGRDDVRLAERRLTILDRWPLDRG
jgi:hypothetical protein